LIRLGEGQTIEFKLDSERDFTDVIAKATGAFANTNDGIILIGVSDDGNIVGVRDDPKRVEERVMGICRSRCNPVPALRIEHTEVLALKAVPTAFERTVVEGAGWDDLDLPRLIEYLKQRAPGAIENGMPPERLAVSLGLAEVRGKEALPTVAGVTLFGKHPQWLRPQWGLSALRISGTDITDPIVDRAEFEGTADQLIEQGEAFVRRNLRVAAIFVEVEDHVERRDIPEYPVGGDYIAMREAIANAVAHRDYSTNEKVTLRIYEDRLEVRNPGGLVWGLKLEELLREGGRSAPRNEIIANVLRDYRKMETVGRGLLRIQREMQALGAEPPVFRDERTSFLVVLPSRHKGITNRTPAHRESRVLPRRTGIEMVAGRQDGVCSSDGGIRDGCRSAWHIDVTTDGAL